MTSGFDPEDFVSAGDRHPQRRSSDNVVWKVVLISAIAATFIALIFAMSASRDTSATASKVEAVTGDTMSIVRSQRRMCAISNRELFDSDTGQIKLLQDLAIATSGLASTLAAEASKSREKLIPGLPAAGRESLRDSIRIVDTKAKTLTRLLKDVRPVQPRDCAASYPMPKNR